MSYNRCTHYIIILRRHICLKKIICMLLSFIALISVSCSTVHGPSVPTPNAASPAPLQTPYSAAGQSNIRIDTPETLPPKSPSKTAMPATIDMLQQLISKAESYAGAGDYANAIDTFTLILSRLEDCSLNTLALTCDAYIGIADAYEKLYGYEKALDVLADGILEIYSSLGADASYDLRVRWLEIRLRHAENVAEPAKYNERLVSRLAYLMSCQTPFFSKKDIDKKNHIGRLFYMYYWSDEFVGPDDYDDIVDSCYTLSAEKANATVKNVFGVSIPDYKADYIDETSDFYCRDGVYRFSLGDFWLYFDSMTLTPLSSDEYLLEYTIHGIPDGPNTDGSMIKYGPGRIIIRADESSSYGFIVTAVINNPFDAARIVH